MDVLLCEESRAQEEGCGSGRCGSASPSCSDAEATATGLPVRAALAWSRCSPPWAWSSAAGLVQRVDPESLATMGPAIGLRSPLGAAALDGQGTLWVPVPSTGQVVPIRAGRQGTPVGVGHPGDPMTLTVAQGAAVVTDAA